MFARVGDSLVCCHAAPVSSFLQCVSCHEKEKALLTHALALLHTHTAINGCAHTGTHAIAKLPWSQRRRRCEEITGTLPSECQVLLRC